MGSIAADTSESMGAGAVGQTAAPADSFYAFRRQESALILLNLCLIVSLMIVHILFKSALGMPANWLILLFGLRFLMQTAELMVLQSATAPWSVRYVRWYGHASIVVHLVFAAVVSLLTQKEDSHYTVLMVIPLVAAAFRYSLPTTFAVAAVAGAVSVIEVRLMGAGQPLSEYFEAVSMGLIFALVVIVVHVLVRQLQHEQAHRQRALEELARTREKLAQEEKLAAIGRVASAVAHEIRNPIAMISSSFSAMDECPTDQETQREMFGIARSEAKRLQKFTGDFLAYARMSPPQCDSIEGETLIRYVASLARAEAASKDVHLQVDGESGCRIEGDTFQLQQALLNLILNALDATQKGKSVRIGCGLAANRMELFVENNGQPIPQDIAAQMFEPFYTTKPRGTGLGLGIARNIAQAHGGDLLLARNDMEHVRFVLWLPVPAAQCEGHT